MGSIDINLSLQHHNKFLFWECRESNPELLGEKCEHNLCAAFLYLSLPFFVRLQDSELGIIPRALNDIFDNLRIGDTVESFVRVSFVELYNEEIFDLLSGHNDQTRLR